MLSYKEYDNAQAVEIVLSGRVSTEEFDKVARKLEAFIERHGEIRVLENQGLRGQGLRRVLARRPIQPKVCSGFQPDRHRDQSRRASSLVEPRCARCDVEHFSPGEMEAARDWLMWPEGAVD